MTVIKFDDPRAGGKLQKTHIKLRVQITGGVRSQLPREKAGEGGLVDHSRQDNVLRGGRRKSTKKVKGGKNAHAHPRARLSVRATVLDSAYKLHYHRLMSVICPRIVLLRLVIVQPNRLNGKRIGNWAHRNCEVKKNAHTHRKWIPPFNRQGLKIAKHREIVELLVYFSHSFPSPFSCTVE